MIIMADNLWDATTHFGKPPFPSWSSQVERQGWVRWGQLGLRSDCIRSDSVGLEHALGGLVVSVLATGPTGYSVAGSNPTQGSGFLWVIKIPSTHFLRSHVM
jgi:hypothetical protein